MAWQALLLVYWKMIVYSVLSLTVIRLIAIGLSLWGTGLQRQTVLFLAWFGPRGLVSILFALIILPEVEMYGRDAIVITVTVTVLSSIFAHGFTARPFAHWFGKQCEHLLRTKKEAIEFEAVESEME